MPLACGSARRAAPVPVPDPGKTAVLYYLPGIDPKGLDGSLYLHEVASSNRQALGADRLLLKPVGPTYPVETHTTVALNAWEVAADDLSGFGTIVGIPVNSTGTRPAPWSVQSGRSWVTAIDPNGDVAYESGADVETVAPDGRVRSYTVPAATSGDLGLDCYKPPPDIGGGLGASPNALVFGPYGHLIVAAGNGVNAELVDLTSGRRLDLPGYGWIEGMVYAPDGNLYLVGLGQGVSGACTGLYTYTFLEVSYSSFKLGVITPTTYHPMGGTSFSIAVTSKAAFAYVTFPDGPDAPGGPRKHQLFQLRLGTRAVEELPVSISADYVHGVGENLLFYGGLARNVVTRWDPSAGPMAQVAVSTTMAPTGSFVEAVFPG